MAKFNGANLRYDNSDNESRAYDISCEIVVNNGTVTAVQSINANKNGMNVLSGNFNDLGGNSGGMMPDNGNVNFYNLPVDEYKAVFSATTDFVLGLVTKVEAENAAESTE